jgi:transcriptional regulator with XRE-family HTH domain
MSEDKPQSVSSILRQARLNKKLSLTYVAGLIDKSPSYLCEIESGACRATPEILRKLAKVYGMDVKELMLLALVEHRAAAIKKVESKYMNMDAGKNETSAFDSMCLKSL